MKYTCPCCGYKTLDDIPPGTHDICDICFWEDDEAQYTDVNFEGGANSHSLRQAQKNYLAFGASNKRCIEFVRKPNKQDIRDSNWKPL